MPVIKVLHVCSVSSEDPSHPADNLFNLETYRKWKCASAGEKKAIVVLQLEKSSQIHAIDIGNDGSAFVEVLVGRSTEPDKYEAFLGMSTFMTSQESKQWSSANSRVRIFGKEKFSKTTADQKWDRVKIICTQPYNKSEKYGLSFIKLHSPPSDDTPTSPSKQQTKLGAFTLKDEKEDLPSGSLFFRKEHSNTTTSSPKTITSLSKPITSSPGVSTAAQARMATAAALKSDQSYSSASRSKPGGDESVVAKKRQATPTGGTPKRRKVTDAPAASKDDSIPFEEIMPGVVIALSGFKNPFRGELREKALEMGAKYEADWGPSCTHLICAFANTPKFNQVKAKRGLIVKKEWILDSYIKKRRLPARKYRLSSGSGDTSSSEEDLYDKKEKEIFGKKKKEMKSTEEEDAFNKGGVNERDDLYDGSTDEEMDTDVKSKPLPHVADNESSECDTEDEIERIRQRQARPLHGKDPEDDPYGGSTDEENEVTEQPPSAAVATSSSLSSSKSLLSLPGFLSKCVFLFYGDFSAGDRRLLSRYITAYNGSIEEYMSSRITHVVTQADWDDSFDKALTENSALVFVKPKWIFMCHKKQACVPYQPYIVVPV